MDNVFMAKLNENTLKTIPTDVMVYKHSTCTHTHTQTFTHMPLLDIHHYTQQDLWQFRMTCHSLDCFHLATLKAARLVMKGAAAPSTLC